MTATLLRRIFRFVVTYQDDDDPFCTMTFEVHSTSASIATARAIGFIEGNKLHNGENGYSLTPRLSKEKTDFTID